MYEILRRTPGRPWAPLRAGAEQPIPADATLPLVLRMRENRSCLSNDGRKAIAALAVVFMAMTLTFALRGLWFIPLFSMAAVAALIFAVDRHARRQATSEVLELSRSRARHRDRQGRVVELPSAWLRLKAEHPTPSELRLFLRAGDRRIEFGRCLSLDEKRAVIPIVAAALAEVRAR
jgi:uncharacterized membrane protein